MDMMLRFDFMDCDGVALKLTIDGLIQKFSQTSGEEFSNDRALLS